jgi:acyl-CoA thioesterase-2
MEPLEFLGMEQTSDALHWRLPVTTAVSTPGRFLYGGAGLAAGIVAMEAATQRPTVWATAQYLTYAPTGSVLRLRGGPACRR